MLADLIRTLGLWRAQAGWLAAGIAVSAGSTLLGVALLALAGQGIAAALGGAALGGGLAFLLLRPLVALRPAARWSERMVTHAATFRALADTRIWFFRRLADRLPGGIGLGRSGDLLGGWSPTSISLDGLYLRALVPVCSALAVVLAGAALLAGAPLLAAIVALPLAVALLLPLLLAPGAARAAAQAAAAQGRLRAAAIDPLLGVEDVLAANGEQAAGATLAREAAALARAQRGLGWRAAWAGAAGTLLVQAALLGALAWGLSPARRARRWRCSGCSSRSPRRIARPAAARRRRAGRRRGRGTPAVRAGRCAAAGRRARRARAPSRPAMRSGSRGCISPGRPTAPRSSTGSTSTSPRARGWRCSGRPASASPAWWRCC